MTFRSVGAPSTGTTTTLQVPVPPGAASGDVVVVNISSRIVPDAVTAPAGMMLKADAGLNTQRDTRGRLLTYYKILTGADTGTYDFSWATAAAAVPEGVAIAFYDVKNVGDPFVTISGGQSATSGNSTTATTLTPTGATRDLVIAGATAGDCTFVGPSQSIERYDASKRLVVSTEAYVAPSPPVLLTRNISATEIVVNNNTFTRWFIGALHPPVLDVNFSTVSTEVLGTADAVQAQVSSLDAEVLGSVTTPTALISTLTAEVLGVRTPVQHAVSTVLVEVLGIPDPDAGLSLTFADGAPVLMKFPGEGWVQVDAIG